MDLITPDTDALLDFMQEDEDDDVEAWGDQVLQQASDLFIIATGITLEPTNSFQVRLKNNAILNLAQWFIATAEDREASYSPFTSERIGSYSYSKALQSINARQPVGVLWFDQAVAWFANNVFDASDPFSGGAAWHKAENVFATSYHEYNEREFGRRVVYGASGYPGFGNQPDVSG